MVDLSDFEEHVRDLLSPVGPVRIRRMFGGSGIYADDAMFALIAYDELYFKADETTAQRFEDAGSRPFTYEGKGKPVRMSYWRVPEDALDDPESFRAWAELALEAARRAKAKQPAKKRAGRGVRGRASGSRGAA